MVSSGAILEDEIAQQSVALRGALSVH